MGGIAFGVEGVHLPADVEARLRGSHVPIEILDVHEIVAVDLRAIVDAEPGTAIEYRVLPVDRDRQETEWTPWVPDVVSVPEPGLTWAYLACALLLLAFARRRFRR